MSYKNQTWKSGRYYHGEKENPFDDGKDHGKALLWFYEEKWEELVGRGLPPADTELLETYVEIMRLMVSSLLTLTMAFRFRTKHSCSIDTCIGVAAMVWKSTGTISKNSTIAVIRQNKERASRPLSFLSLLEWISSNVGECNGLLLDDFNV